MCGAVDQELTGWPSQYECHCVRFCAGVSEMWIFLWRHIVGEGLFLEASLVLNVKICPFFFAPLMCSLTT